LYTADPDKTPEWEEKTDPKWKKIKDWFYRIFLSDVRIVRIQIAKLIVRSLILVAFFLFWVEALYTGSGVVHEFAEPVQWLAAIVGCITILFGGIVTDTLIEKHGVFEKFALVAVAPLLVLIYTSYEPVLIAAILVLSVLLGFLLILFFTGLLINTTMLNRARVIVLLVTIMAIFTGPVIAMLVVTQTQFIIWIIILVLGTGSLAISKKYPRRFTPHVQPFMRKLSLRGYFRIISESNLIRHAVFLFFITFTLGYHTVTAIASIQESTEYWVFGIAAFASLPLIATVFDNFGRKPLVYAMLALVGIFAIFYDLPGVEATPVRIVRIGVYGFSVMLTLTYAVVLAGDLSSSFSRGRITGILLFTVILGAILGVMMGNGFDSHSATPILRTEISDWTSITTLVATFLFITTRELLQAGTTNWRNHLIRLHVIMENGLSLVFKEFKKRRSGDCNDTMEDLETGALSGLQSLLQEIASSKKRLRVLDHGDTFLIFHHGTSSTAVLFVEKNLVIYREKLANFHLQFESINGDVIKDNFVNLEEIKHVDWLIEHYFT